MSTDVRDEIAAAGEGGDDGLSPSGATERESEESTAPEWLTGADEETIKYVASRGWDKDPSGLIKSQREAERALRAEQQARADMERELAEIRHAVESGQITPYDGGGQGDEDPFGIAAVAAAYENGEISAAQMLQHAFVAGLQANQQILQEQLGQAMEPVVQHQTAATLERTAAEIAAAYPDFNELSDEVLQLIERQPAKYGDPEGMWAAYGLVKSRRQVKEAAERRRAEGAETLDAGSRGQQQAVAASEAIRKELAQAYQRPDDGL
jgi:hypothetical protein